MLGRDKIVGAIGRTVDKVTKAIAALKVAVTITTANLPPSFEPEEPPQKQEQPEKAKDPKPDASGGEPPKDPKGPVRVEPGGKVRVDPNP